MSKPKKLKVVKSKTNTGVNVHDLSVKTPPTHKAIARLTSEIDQQNAVDFVMGFGFPKEVFTTGKKQHDDFRKTFKLKKK